MLQIVYQVFLQIASTWQWVLHDTRYGVWKWIDPNDLLIQKSAAQDYDEPLVISTIESLSGLRSRALLSGASSSPTLEEIAALQGGYSSDSDASTVLLEEGPRSPAEPPVPQWSPTSAAAIDPILVLLSQL